LVWSFSGFFSHPCDKIRFLPHYAGRLWDVDVFYLDNWHNIVTEHSATGNEWQEIEIGSTQIVSKVRIRQSLSTEIRHFLYEVDFNEVEGGPTPGWNKILYTSEPPTPNAWNQVKREAGTGWRKLLYT